MSTKDLNYFVSIPNGIFKGDYKVIYAPVRMIIFFRIKYLYNMVQFVCKAKNFDGYGTS